MESLWGRGVGAGSGGVWWRGVGPGGSSPKPECSEGVTRGVARWTGRVGAAQGRR